MNIFENITQIKSMKKYVLVAVTLIVSVLIMGATTIIPSQVFSREAVALTVTGTGVVNVPPDFATISLSIETKSKNLEEAQRDNSAIVQKLVNVLGSYNIAEQDITTSWFNIYPEYDYSYSQRFLGHRVSNHLSIKVRDVYNVGKIIDLSTATGTNIISGVQFSIEDNFTAYNEALAKAVESAKQKAKVLSSMTNLGDLKVISIKESPVNYYGFGRYDYAMCLDGISNTPIMHNSIEVSATVEVIFAL